MAGKNYTCSRIATNILETAAIITYKNQAIAPQQEICFPITFEISQFAMAIF
jgi:hypothetical protein